MHLPHHPFKTIDWSSVEKVKHTGTSGYATWQTIMHGETRVRMVEYSAGYYLNQDL